jgi:hypothetical protein
VWLMREEAFCKAGDWGVACLTAGEFERPSFIVASIVVVSG